jgi:hypothetical protein
MRHTFPGGRGHQRQLVDRRLDELEARARLAAECLLRESFVERRARSASDVEREMARLRRERARVDQEPSVGPEAPEEELSLHLGHIENQLREVLSERDRWFRESLDGRRRRQEDFRLMQRLKEESERLTAELMRCASALCETRDVVECPDLRRVWQMLRLSGS